jgi:hypothetical membrane protein
VCSLSIRFQFVRLLTVARLDEASFILLGVIILSGVVLGRSAFPTGWFSGAGLTLLSLAGAGIILVGLFPENENIALHRVGAAGHFVVGNLAVALLGIALTMGNELGAGLTQTGERPALAIYSIVSGVVGLAATALFITDHYLGLGIGGMERVAAYPLPLWLIVAGISFARNAPVTHPTN